MLPTAHSRLSPSGAALWMNCAGGPALLARLALPPEKSSAFAAEGSAAHFIRDLCLEFGFDAYDFIGTIVTADGFEFECDDDMAAHLQPGIDRIREFDGDLYCERKVNTTPWVGKDPEGKDQFGTLDAAVVGADEIVISDLKYGMGVPVQAVGNKQLRIYLLAFYNDIARHVSEATRFRIIIDQPRNAGGGGEWIITLDDLLAFGEEVRAAADATRDPNAKCTPGEAQCMWCAAAKIDNACPAHETWRLDFLGLDFEDLDADEPPDLPDRDLMTPERRRYVNAHAHLIKKWLDRLHADELEEVLERGELCGVKAVPGRAGKRTHVDEARSEAWLRKRGVSEAKIFKRQLITVAQIDKVLGKGVFPKSLVVQGVSKPVLVPVEDDRTAIIRKAEFEDLGDEDDDLL